MSMQVLATSQVAAWTQAIEHCQHHDFYHLPQYHELAQSSGEGKALLFHHVEGDYSIALPLLLRPLEGLPGVHSDLKHLNDATSVYGYPGPIASHEDIPADVLSNFRASLQKHLRDRDVVAVFSRLHPLFPQQALIAGMGEHRTLSRTVSIDLTLPPDVQRAAFRKSHKDAINKLRRQGVTTIHDREGKYLDAFIEIYYETMRRVGASLGYFFTPAYFQKFFEVIGDRSHLVICLHEGNAVSGGIFVECGGILQYHLGGTTNAALRLAPMKLVHDDTRIWANQRGLKTYHLGGGATSRPSDSLLHFKLGFSHRTHEFSVWRWVLLGDVYRRVCEETSRWNQQNGIIAADRGFFPEYRAPATQLTAESSPLVNPEVIPDAPSLSQGVHS